MMIFITVYAAIHLAEDIMKEVFGWLEWWRKEKLRKRNMELSKEDTANYFRSCLEYELSLLGYYESRYSRKYDTMTFISADNSIAIGADGKVYDCDSDEVFAEVTQKIRIVTEVTELWRKSIPISEDDMFGCRILVKIGNRALAAKRSIFSGMDYALLTYEGKTFGYEQVLGTDYAFAKEEFALNLLKDNVPFLPADEVSSKKGDIFDKLLELAEGRRE